MKTILHLILLLLLTTNLVQAVEVAPRITDREIIEGLADLKGEIRAIDQRFEAIDQRFEAVDQRFDQMDKQFDKIWNLMLVMIAGIFGLIGFIVWDRKTALKPLETRLDRIEAELHNDLEIQHQQGSKITRLINALRELAQTDPKVAGVLKSFSLL